MGLTPAGFVFPHKTPAFDKASIAWTEDFLDGNNALGKPPAIGGGAANPFNNADASHPGVYTVDISASPAAGFQTYIGSSTQGVMLLNEYATCALEFLMQLTTLGASTALGFAAGMNTGNNACNTSVNWLGFMFSSNLATCSVPPIVNRLFGIANTGGVASTVNLANFTPLIGTWVKYRLAWTKASNTVEFFVNGASLGSLNTNVPLNQVQPSVFGFNSNGAGVPGAGAAFLFDYVTFSGTLAR